MPTSGTKCVTCKEERSIAFESVRLAKKHARSWFIAWLITFIALLTLLGGIMYYVTTSEIEVITQDGSGVNNYIGNDGDINNGSTGD